MRTIGLIVFLAGAALPAAAHAQDARAEARSIFEEAERQFHAGNHQLALDGFVRSRELVANEPRASALILFNIARAQEELGRYREAVEAFEQYLMDSPDEAPFREETQDRVRELRARLAASGERPASASGTSSPLPLVGGIVLGIGGLTALVAIPTGVLALDGTSQLEAACPGRDCPASEAGRIDDTHTMGVVTDVLWVSGLSIAAIGATRLVLGLAGDTGGAEAASLTPSFACTNEACIAAVT